MKNEELRKQTGQILILLLLVMLVTLTFALAVAQHSLTYLSNSNKSEQGSRAFSVAQAGIEQALGGSGTQSVPLLSNQASASIAPAPFLPPCSNNEAIEYPPIGKDTPAQIWVSDPGVSPGCGGATFPKNGTFIVYYGNYNPDNSDDPTSYNYINLHTPSGLPAVEVNYVTLNSTTSTYVSHKYYFDGYSSRNPGLANLTANSTCQSVAFQITTTTNSVTTTPRYFACKTPSIPPASSPLPANETPILIRVRLLYSDISQVVAVEPQNGTAFPPQVQIFNSTGFSGQTQKAIQVFKAPFVVPPFLDYAIFAQTNIKK